MEVRKQQHEWDAKRGSDFVFHRALRKYGFDAFEWKVLMEEEDERWLNRWERYYIKRMKTRAPNGYNLTDGGEGSVGLQHTEEAKKKIRGYHNRSDVKEKHIQRHTGRKRPVETGQRISRATKGKTAWNRGKSNNQLGMKRSDEARANMKAAQNRPEVKAKVSEAGRGRTVTVVAKARMRVAQTLRRQKEKARKTTIRLFLPCIGGRR